MKDKIQVSARLRPLKTSEQPSAVVWESTPTDDGIVRKGTKECYNFENVFGPSVSNEQLFNFITPIVENVLKGFNGSVMGYGQSGSGKTHTLTGSPGSIGLVQLTMIYIFNRIREMDVAFCIKVSYLQVYNEKVLDLLSSEGQGEIDLPVREDGSGQIIIDGLTQNNVTSMESINEVLQIGNDRRQVGATLINDRSSRSHTILQITVESAMNHEGNAFISTLNMVDLAGSESSSQTGATGGRAKEGQMINKSLLHFSRVVQQLSDGLAHVSYRDSKLTRILKTSLGGNALTAIICTLNPCDIVSTASTLKFAKAAMKVSVKAVQNKKKDGEGDMAKYLEKIAALTKQVKDNAETEKERNRLQQKLEACQKLLLGGGVDQLLGHRPNQSRSVPNRRFSWAPGSSFGSFSLSPYKNKNKRQPAAIEEECVQEKKIRTSDPFLISEDQLDSENVDPSFIPSSEWMGRPGSSVGGMIDELQDQCENDVNALYDDDQRMSKSSMEIKIATLSEMLENQKELTIQAEERAQDAENDNKSLLSRINLLQEADTSQKTEKESLEKRTVEWENERVCLDEKRKELEKRVECLEGELETARKDSTTVSNKALIEEGQFVKELAQVNSARIELEEKVKTLEHELFVERTTRSGIQSEFDSLQERMLKSQDGDAKQYAEMLSSLRKSLADEKCLHEKAVMEHEEVLLNQKNVVDQLKKEIDVLRSEHEAFVSQLKTTHELEMNNVKEMIEKTNGTVNKLEGELCAERACTVSLRSQLTTLKEESVAIGEVEEKYREMKRECEQAKSAVSALRLEEKEQQERLDHLQKKNDEMMEKHRRDEIIITDLRDELTTSHDDRNSILQRLTDEKAEREMEKKQFESKLSELQNSCARKGEELVNMDRDYGQKLKDAENLLSGDIISLKADHQQEKERLEGEIREKHKEIEKIQCLMSNQRSQVVKEVWSQVECEWEKDKSIIRQLTLELNVLREAHNTILNQTIHPASADNDALNGQIEELKRELELNREKLKERENHIEELSQQKKQVEMDRQVLRGKFNNQQQLLEDVKNSLQSSRLSTRQLEEELKEEKEEKREMNQKKETVLESLRILEQGHKTLKGLYEKCQSDLKAAKLTVELKEQGIKKQQNLVTRAEIGQTKLETQLGEMKKKMEEMEKELRETRDAEKKRGEEEKENAEKQSLVGFPVLLNDKKYLNLSQLSDRILDLEQQRKQGLRHYNQLKLENEKLKKNNKEESVSDNKNTV